MGIGCIHSRTSSDESFGEPRVDKDYRECGCFGKFRVCVFATVTLSVDAAISTRLDSRQVS